MITRAERVTVAVIGGGPAGATAAALLARSGVDVALVERDTFPRDKVCGEFLSWDAFPVLDQLGVTAAIDAAGAPHVRRCRLVTGRSTYEFELPGVARGISRRMLDALLFHTAVSSGATPWEGWTAARLEPAPPQGRAAIVLTREEEEVRIEADVILAAWGRWGRFDTQLGRAFVRDRAHRSFGFKRHYVRARGAADRDLIELYSFRRGYLGVNSIETGEVNLCGLVDARRLAQHRGRWDAFVDQIRREQPAIDALYEAHEASQESFLSSDPVVFRPRSAVENGILMLGDASGIVDPLAGNGMAMAIQSGLLAAIAARRILGRPAARQDQERAYVAEHAAFFRPRIGWSRRVARLLSRPRLIGAALHLPGARSTGGFLSVRTRGNPEEVERLVDRWIAQGG